MTRYGTAARAALDPRVASFANVTLAEVEYRGLSATVHDGVGHTATATFLRLRIVYRVYDEPALAASAPAGRSRAAGTEIAGMKLVHAEHLLLPDLAVCF